MFCGAQHKCFFRLASPLTNSCSTGRDDTGWEGEADKGASKGTPRVNLSHWGPSLKLGLRDGFPSRVGQLP